MLKKIGYIALTALLLGNPYSSYSREAITQPTVNIENFLKKKLKMPDKDLENIIANLDTDFIQLLNVKKSYDIVIKNYNSVEEEIMKYELKEVAKDKKIKLSNLFNEIGIAYAGRALWTFAEKDFTSAYELNDKNLYSLINLANASFETEDYKNALLFAKQYLDKGGEQRHKALQIIEDSKLKINQ